jgi:putative addiction module component (TIGR02574 family)
MADIVEDLAAQGRELPPEQRVRLLDLLLESLQAVPSETHDAAWDQEIARRVAAHERGEGQLHDADEVMAEAQRLAP